MTNESQKTEPKNEILTIAKESKGKIVDVKLNMDGLNKDVWDHKEIKNFSKSLEDINQQGEDVLKKFLEKHEPGILGRIFKSKESLEESSEIIQKRIEEANELIKQLVDETNMLKQQDRGFLGTLFDKIQDYSEEITPADKQEITPADKQEKVTVGKMTEKTVASVKTRSDEKNQALRL